MTVTYDPADFNEVTVLLRWRGTIMPAVLCRPVIWLLLLAHCTFLYLHVKRQDIEMPLLDWKIVAVPTGLLTFFLVFYSGNCFNRYYQLYGKCTGMAGAVMIWVGLLRLFFPRASTQTLWNLCRHAVASVYVFYFQLGGGGSDGGRVITESEWAVRRRATLGAIRRNSAQFCVIAHVLLSLRLQVLLKHNMLSEEEVQQVAVYRGFKPFLLQVWAMQTIRDYLDSGADKAAGAGIGPFQAQALALRANCSDVVNLLAQPVPFPYYHVVSFMLCVNLFGMAYAAAQFGAQFGAQFSARKFSAQFSPRNSLRAILCAQFFDAQPVHSQVRADRLQLGDDDSRLLRRLPRPPRDEGDRRDALRPLRRRRRRLRLRPGARRRRASGHHPIPAPGHPALTSCLPSPTSLTPPLPAASATPVHGVDPQQHARAPLARRRPQADAAPRPRHAPRLDQRRLRRVMTC